VTVKSLLVKISADITGLQAGLKGADERVKKHAELVKKAGIAISVAGTAITGAIGLMVKSYVSAGDSLLEMSQRTGMSTTELSKLKYVASLCGTDLETVEMAVKKMASSLVDAATKGGPAAAAFSTIGLKVQDLLRLTPDQQFDKIAKAVAAIEDPTIRAATAADIFGARVGTKLLPMLAGGVDAFEAMKEEALKLGIVMSDEDCRNADALRDALTKLQGSVTGIGNSLAATLVPIIQGVAATITNIAIKVKDWTKEHPELSSAIVKVVTALGLFMVATGSLLIVLSKVMTSLKLLGLAKTALLGPIGLVVAALSGLAIGYLSVKAAQDKAKEAADRYNEVAANFRAKLQEAATAAGLTAVQFDALTQKYGENYAAMGMAIVRGKEGVALQTALKTVGQEHKEVIDAQKQAIIDKQNAEIQGMLVSEEAKKQAETITTTRQQLTDAIQKGTLSEYEYQKWALQAAYAERQTAINTEITDVAAKHELLLLAQQSHNVQLAALEKAHRDTELQARIEFAKIIFDQEAAQTIARLEALRAFAVEKQSITDAINQMTMGELQYKLWAIDQERLAEEQHIKDSKEWTAAEQEELLKSLDIFYEKKRQKAEADASGWTELVENTKGAITGIMGNLFAGTLDAFKEWGEGGVSILDALGEAFKNTVNAALSALRDLVTGMILASVKQVLMAKAVAIANVIKSVMASIPFPLNLALVGVAIAGVSALFSKIKLGEGGIVTRPTYAMIGERGPEAVIPLDRPGVLAFAGAGVSLRQQNYFYGDINNAGDLDEISRRLAERTIRAISKGRR